MRPQREVDVLPPATVVDLGIHAAGGAVLLRWRGIALVLELPLVADGGTAAPENEGDESEAQQASQDAHGDQRGFHGSRPTRNRSAVSGGWRCHFATT